MPVTYKVNRDEDFAWIRFGSRFNLQEVLDAVAGFRREGGSECRRLFEFDRPLTNFLLENIRRVSDSLRPAGPGKAIAFVADNDLSLEVCEAIMRQIPRHLPVKIFSNRSDAETWLKAQRSPG